MCKQSVLLGVGCGSDQAHWETTHRQSTPVAAGTRWGWALTAQSRVRLPPKPTQTTHHASLDDPHPQTHHQLVLEAHMHTKVEISPP